MQKQNQENLLKLWSRPKFSDFVLNTIKMCWGLICQVLVCSCYFWSWCELRCIGWSLPQPFQFIPLPPTQQQRGKTQFIKSSVTYSLAFVVSLGWLSREREIDSSVPVVWSLSQFGSPFWCFLGWSCSLGGKKLLVVCWNAEDVPCMQHGK